MNQDLKYTTPGKLEDIDLPNVSPADEDAKQKVVQFTVDTQDTKHQTLTAHKRGLVSRRGGRFVSPGRRQETSKDEVPSLCSINSHDHTVPSPIPASGQRTMTPPPNRDPKKTPKTPEDFKMSPGVGLFLGSPTGAYYDDGKFLDSKPSPRFITTPTDFALDYGKHQSTPGSLDTSNVLAWLQSPTAHGLFSPGPSVSNTPRKQPTTPRTPTVSTSFFFSDVANLPQDGVTPSRSASRASNNNIICISPLATKTQGTQKDLFEGTSPEVPDVGETPDRCPRLTQRSGSMDPSLDAAMAERDLMEDEDLSVLIKLASSHTPRRGMPRAGAESTTPGRQGGLPSLQLPEIGNSEKDTITPQINMRANSGSQDNPHDHKSTREPVQDTTGDHRSGPKNDANHYTPRMHYHPASYPPRQFYHGGPHYYTGKSAFSSEMPPSGTMRISVGGPPPQRRPPGPPGSGGSPYQHDYYPSLYSGYPGYPYPYHTPHPPPASARSARQALLEPDPDRPPSPPHAPKFSLLDKSPKGVAAMRRSSPSPESPTTAAAATTSTRKRSRSSQGRKKRPTHDDFVADQQKSAETIQNIDGGRNSKAADLAAAILRGVTMRPSGKWQAQLYFAGKSRYIGVFDSREKAALAYEIAREKLKNGGNGLDPINTEDLVNEARKAAFDGVNEQF